MAPTPAVPSARRGTRNPGSANPAQDAGTVTAIVAGRDPEADASARANRRAAETSVVEANLGLVHSVARRYEPVCRYLSRDDLVQEGVFGLLEAAARFDPDRGLQFSTYAVYWIRRYIHRAVNYDDRGMRGADRNDQPRLGSLDAGHLRHGPDGASIGARVSDLAALDPFDAVERSMDSALAEAALDVLEPLEAAVLRARVGIGQEPQSRTETAEALGLPRRTVSTLESDALSKLRHPLVALRVRRLAASLSATDAY